MERLTLFLVLLCASLVSCRSDGSTSAKTNSTMHLNENLMHANQNDNVMHSFYDENNKDTHVQVKMSADQKHILECVYIDEKKQEFPIVLTNLEYLEDVNMFMGEGECEALGSEALVGIDSALTRFGWNDGKIKRVFIK